MNKKITIGAVVAGTAAGLYWLLCHCSHHFSFPFTDKKTKVCYVVCVKCGKKCEYDWKTCKIGKQIKEEK